MALRFGLAASVLIGGLALCPEAKAQVPVAGVAYQVPSAYASVPPGTLIPYGGFNYVAQGNGTMLLAASQAPSPPPVASYAPPVTYVNPGYVPYTNYYAPVRPGWRPQPYRPFGGFGPAPLSPWDGWGMWPGVRRGGVFIGR